MHGSGLVDGMCLDLIHFDGVCLARMGFYGILMRVEAGWCRWEGIECDRVMMCTACGVGSRPPSAVRSLGASISLPHSTRAGEHRFHRSWRAGLCTCPSKDCGYLLPRLRSGLFVPLP